MSERVLAQDSSNEVMRRHLALAHFQIGEVCSNMAARANTPAGERFGRWSEARNAFQRSLDLLAELRDKGALLPEDANKTEQVARKITACDAALAKR